MTNEDLADLIVARTASLREHLDARPAASDDRSEPKLAAMQAHILDGLLSMGSDMLSSRGDVARLREAVAAQARAQEAKP